MPEITDSFDVVYYPQQVPSLETLTLLSLVFDRIYFPGVYIPAEGIDEEETKKEIIRLRNLGFKRIESIQVFNCVVYALHNKYLKDICVFTGKPEFSDLEDGAGELTHALEELIYGPPPEGFIPESTLRFSKGLPGEEEASVNGPGPLVYPANALIYSSRTGIPLINDDPNLPVPGLPEVSPKANAKLLSTMLALESVKMALPNLKRLLPQEIMEFREETKEHVKPFRLAMLKLSKDLNSAIKSDMTLEKVQKEAQFLVQTTVYPELEELKQLIHDPSKPWYKRVVDLAREAPELAASLAAMPSQLAVAKILSKIVGRLADLRDDQLDKEQQMARGGFHYLLKVGSLNKA